MNATNVFVRAARYDYCRMRQADESPLEMDWLFKHLVDHTDALDFDSYGRSLVNPSIYLR